MMHRIIKKDILFFLFMIGVAMMLIPRKTHAELKIGYIRPQYIFGKYEPYKQAQKQMQDYEKEEVDKLKKQSEEFQKEVENSEKQAILMSEEVIAKKREELNIRRQSLDKFYDELYKTPDGKLAKKQEELLQPVINRINEVITRIGKEESYDFIFDAEGPLLFADEKYDISDYILEALQKDVTTK